MKKDKRQRGTTMRTKRRASSDNQRKRKRENSPDGEEPSSQLKKWRLQADEESPFTPTDTRTEGRTKEAKTTSSPDQQNKRKRKSSRGREEPPALLKKRRLQVDEESPSTLTDTRRAAFDAKYVKQKPIGKGGCGSVFAGYRKVDNSPVAIKYIPKDKVLCKERDGNGKLISGEVAIMTKLSCGSAGSVGDSAPVSLFDWYDLQRELILVLERPVPAQDLLQYIDANGGCLEEEEAKIIMKQLVDAAIHLQDKHIFHRDIKVENILIETGSGVPRVRLIDFGSSCSFKRRSSYHIFYGTVQYSPPEWYNSCTYTAGPTTVWQVGVVLFEMVHTNANFNTARFLMKRLRISRDLSDHCRDFLEMCLTDLPQKRPTLGQLRSHPWLS